MYGASKKFVEFIKEEGLVAIQKFGSIPRFGDFRTNFLLINKQLNGQLPNGQPGQFSGHIDGQSLLLVLTSLHK